MFKPRSWSCAQLLALHLAASAALLTGCASHKSISDTDVGRRFIGDGVMLRPSFICEVAAPAPVLKVLPPYELYENFGFSECPNGEHVSQINPGSKVLIEDMIIQTINTDGLVDRWYLLGRVWQGDKIYPFYFYYGLGYFEEGAPFRPKSLVWSVDNLD